MFICLKDFVLKLVYLVKSYKYLNSEEKRFLEYWNWCKISFNSNPNFSRDVVISLHKYIHNILCHGYILIYVILLYTFFDQKK